MRRISQELRIASLTGHRPTVPEQGQGADSNRPRGGKVVNQDQGPSRDQPRAAGKDRARCRTGDALLAYIISLRSTQEAEQRQDWR